MLALLGAHHILYVSMVRVKEYFNTFNAELNPICHLLALLGAHHILHVSSIRVKGNFNPLSAELIPIYHLLALLGAHHILHVSRIRVKLCNVPDGTVVKCKQFALMEILTLNCYLQLGFKRHVILQSF